MKKILYVEDHEDTVNAVKSILSNAGFEVDIALTGRAGIKKAKKNHFDLILLDIFVARYVWVGCLPNIEGKN